MLALIAGGGALPRIVAAAQDEAPIVCALEGNQRPAGLDVDHRFRLETLGSLLLTLGNEGVTEICLCGPIDRLPLDPAALDEETKPLVPLFMQALGQGDDGALRVALSIFEQTGFAIRAAHELAPELLPIEGFPTRRTPRESHVQDAKAALGVLAEMGAADLGQACVIRKGRTIAREVEDGTDAMLARLALPDARPMQEIDPAMWAAAAAGDLAGAALDWLQGIKAKPLHEAPGAGAILFKAPKPDQDRRVDLPTIGPLTALRAAEAGLDGIVIESGGVMVIGLAQVIAILDAMDMFLWVRP